MKEVPQFRLINQWFHNTYLSSYSMGIHLNMKNFLTFQMINNEKNTLATVQILRINKNFFHYNISKV